jgi:hypothetical protein
MPSVKYRFAVKYILNDRGAIKCLTSNRSSCSHDSFIKSRSLFIYATTHSSP